MYLTTKYPEKSGLVASADAIQLNPKYVAAILGTVTAPGLAGGVLSRIVITTLPAAPAPPALDAPTAPEPPPPNSVAAIPAVADAFPALAPAPLPVTEVPPVIPTPLFPAPNGPPEAPPPPALLKASDVFNK